MVIGYHIIFSTYGFWLPNDPRGSWSTEVWAPHLRPFGEATKVTTRSSLAGRQHDANARREAKRHLKYPVVRFNAGQIQAVAAGFEDIVAKLELTVYACSIMPDHVHLVTERHARTAEDIAGFLKRAATRRLNAEGIHPQANCRTGRDRVPSPWATDGWYVFLNSPAEVRSRIRYVEANPGKSGLPAQCWPFVRLYAD
jgi:REP element-mobilizing transposase RayT